MNRRREDFKNIDASFWPEVDVNALTAVQKQLSCSPGNQFNYFYQVRQYDKSSSKPVWIDANFIGYSSAA